MAVGPAQRQNTDEMCAAVRGAGQFVFDPPHGQAEIFVRPGPASGIDAWLATQGVDRQAGIIGQGRLAGLDGGGSGLNFRIGAKGLAVLDGLRKA